MDNEQLNNVPSKDDELTHWGIKGMRWGVRRYQTKDGSLTPAGRKRYNDDVAKLKAKNAKLDEKIKAKKAQDRAKARVDKLMAEQKAKKEALNEGKITAKAAKKLAKAKAAEEAKTKKEREIEESLMKKDAAETAKNEAKKAKIIRSQDPEKILENAHLFNNQELNDAVTRLSTEARIRGMIPEKVSRGQEILNKTADVTKKVGEIGNNVAGIYDKAAGIYNVLPKSVKDKWGLGDELPTISGYESFKNRQKEAAKDARNKYLDGLSDDEAVKQWGNLTSEEKQRVANSSSNRGTIEFNYGKSLKRDAADKAHKATANHAKAEKELADAVAKREKIVEKYKGRTDEEAKQALAKAEAAQKEASRKVDILAQEKTRAENEKKRLEAMYPRSK